MLRTAIAWIAVLPFAGWTLMRVLGLDGRWPLVGVIAFTVWAIGGALLATVVALALGRRAAAVVGLVSTLVLAGLVVPRAIGGGDTPEGARPLRVVTLNLLNQGARPEAVIDLVRRKRADVLFLQELTTVSDEALAEAGLRRMLPRRAYGTSDTAVYTHLPMRERRSGVKYATEVVLTAPGERELVLLSVHPRPPISRRALPEWRTILRSIPSTGSGTPRVTAGDFNATLDHSELRDVIGRGYDDAADEAGAGLRTTWPVGRRFPPEITIDHVLVDERLGVGDVSIHVVPGSDHRALYAEVLVPPR